MWTQNGGVKTLDFHTIWGHYQGFPHIMGVFMTTCEIVCGMVFIWKLSQSKEIMLKVPVLLISF